MSEAELRQGNEHAERETWIISRTGEGFRIYTPDNPSQVFCVSGPPDAPSCTCPDFQFHRRGPAWACKHILAVFGQDRLRNGAEEENPQSQKERPAMQNEGRTYQASCSQMLIKRSVSPDGRIDSLSVEFSCPLNGETESEVKERAMRFLELQSGIAAGFLNGNGKGTGSANGNGSPKSQSQTVPARITGIGSSDGKWGKRLFITFDVDGKNLRFYGSKGQIEQRFTEAGYAQLTNLIEEGVRFALPCRVLTEPSRDGKFQNVVQVLAPVQGGGKASA